MDYPEFIEVLSDVQEKLEQIKEQALGGQLSGKHISAVLPSLSRLRSKIHYLTAPSGYTPQPVSTKGSRKPSGSN